MPSPPRPQLASRLALLHWSCLSPTASCSLVSGAATSLFRSQIPPPTRPPSRRSGGHQYHQIRCYHRKEERPIPAPIPFVPNVETFLTLIGRDLKKHSSKIPTWEALFSLTSAQLQELTIEPARTRRYLLRWLERYRNGRFGPGGDFRHVSDDGVAQLRIQVIQTPENPLHRVKRVVNVPPGADSTKDVPADQLVRPLGYRIERENIIVGRYAKPSGVAKAWVKVTEGLWEDRRGHKVDGGERRQAEVRFKNSLAKRRAERGE